jgi:hypothetical protein
MTETPTPDEKVVPADENPIIAGVRAGAAPSYDSGAMLVDENNVVQLQPASLPQLTMPELHGLEEPVVPEGDPTVYGLPAVEGDAPAATETPADEAPAEEPAP